MRNISSFTISKNRRRIYMEICEWVIFSPYKILKKKDNTICWRTSLTRHYLSFKVNNTYSWLFRSTSSVVMKLFLIVGRGSFLESIFLFSSSPSPFPYFGLPQCSVIEREPLLSLFFSFFFLLS